MKTLSAYEQNASAVRLLAKLKYLERREMFIYDQQGAILQAVQAEKLAIARQLLDRLDDATIGQTTRLSIEDVRKLRSQ